MRARFFEAAEDILWQNRGKKLRLVDVASALGMTQSNAYRYFRSKDELVSALAERWFAGVERAAENAIAQAAGPKAKIQGWLLATLNEKTRRFDRDTETFLVYLELAKDHPAAVLRHTRRLRAMIAVCVADLAGQTDIDRSIDALEDATIQFRNPYVIAAQRNKATEARAIAVLDAVFLLFSA